MGVLNLRAAGLIVGVLGSVAGLAGAALAIMRGEIDGTPSPEELGTLTVYGFAALAAYIAGLVGAMSSNAKPRLAAALMLAAAIAGFATGTPNVPATVLLLLGAGLTFSGRNEG